MIMLLLTTNHQIISPVRRRFPEREYQLPPRLITEEISERVGIDDHLGEKGLAGLAILSHELEFQAANPSKKLAFRCDKR